MVLAVAFPLLALAAAGVSTTLSVAAYRRRDRPGARALVVLTASSAVWTASYAAALVTFDVGARQALETLIYLGRGSLPLGWVVFAVSYAGLSDRFSHRHLAAAAVLPSVVFLLTATAPVHGLLWTDYRVVGTAVAGVAFDPGPLFYVHVAYSYTLIGLGTLVILWALAGDGRLLSIEGGAVAAGAGVAFVASLSWLLGVFPIPGVDPTPMVMTLSCSLFALVLFQYDLFDQSPAPRVLGRRVALESFRDPVLITDSDDRVVDANTSATDRLGSDSVGRPASAVLGVDTMPNSGQHTLVVPTTDGNRRFVVSVSPVTNRFERTLGHTLILRDVTRRDRREQRLAVLSRVLRHNLRNDVNVIHGHAATITGATPSDDRAIAAIERAAERLAGLSQKAGTVERVVSADAAPADKASVGEVFCDVVDRVSEEYPDVQFDLDVSTTSRVVVDSEVLFAVAENLVENAAKHGRGRVTVTVETAASETRLRAVVEDDGPGLPEQERETLLADTEGPLRHSSGLGLWVVRWGVDILGGRLTVDSADSGDSADSAGTRISVSLPLAPESAPSGEDKPAARARDASHTRPRENR